MDCSTLNQFRNNPYACFGNAKDALMNTCNALLTETNAHSFAALSLSPCFARRWPSLYEAFDDTQIDQQALQSLFPDTLTGPASGERLVLAADASLIIRPESPPAKDRTYVHPVVHARRSAQSAQSRSARIAVHHRRCSATTTPHRCTLLGCPPKLDYDPVQ